MPVMRNFLAAPAGSGATPVVIENPSTFYILRMAFATGSQTVHLPTANNQKSDIVALRVQGASPFYTVTVQSPPGVTIDTFAVSTNGTRSYMFTGDRYIPFAVSFS